MKNPYLRFVLIVSLMMTVLYVASSLYGFYETTQISNIVIGSTGGNDKISVNYPLATLNTNVVYLSGFPLFIISSVVGHSSALILGSISGTIGPVLIFIGWFVALYLLTYLFAKFIKKNLNPSNVSAKKVIIIILAIVLIVNIAFVYSSKMITNQLHQAVLDFEKSYQYK